jgi:hypothetical protein
MAVSGKRRASSSAAASFSEDILLVIGSIDSGK